MNQASARGTQGETLNPFSKLITIQNFIAVTIFCFGLGASYYAISADSRQALQNSFEVKNEMTIVKETISTQTTKVAKLEVSVQATHDKIDTMKRDSDRHFDQLNSKLDRLLEDALRRP